ncbi:MAG: type II secretion system F family protein [Bacillota bacterium]
MFRVLAIVWLAVLLLARALTYQVLAERVLIAERLAKLVGRRKAKEEVVVASDALVRPPRKRRTWSGRLDLDLRSAGVRLQAQEFVALIVGAIGVATVGGGILGLGLVPGLIAAGVVPVVATKSVQMARVRREFRLAKQVGDAMALMANSLRAGHSLLQAMEAVAQDMPDPISTELKQVLKETAVNIEVESALRRMVERNNCPDLELVVTAVLIQRQVGGNLAEVLDNISATIRERARIAGEVRTLTAQGRMSGLIIGVLPFGLAAILMLINPGYVSLLFTNLIGRVLLGTALVGQVIGVVLIRRLVDLRI